ncbi:hypothetical protein BBW65_03650 [Helicobacter enhydrae]|uniref:DUF2726 domain-containing protein n=2 Tax=Helicobacter enhydrae TaxID=222136 RepID=A0A1B1U575_9HELI|nr:hypothetical protein BBW65_03650 [Helicobacter enhydrae]
MDIEKFLVLIKNEDKTTEIKSINLIDDKFEVCFLNSPKSYYYKESSIVFLANPKTLDRENFDFFNVKKILRFDNYCKVFFFDGEIRLICYKDMPVKKDNANSSYFEYLQEIAGIVGIKPEKPDEPSNTDDQKPTMLQDFYSKIKDMSKKCAFYPYLNRLPIQSREIALTLSPFGLNISQFFAIQNAMKSQISVIEGPPGTGKTQSILNIIANILYEGKNVAVLSNNNSATRNVFEKLEQEGLEYLCANLGKKENVESFIEMQDKSTPYILNDIQRLGKAQRDKEHQKLQDLNIKVQEIFHLQEHIALQKNLLYELELEFKYFKNQMPLPPLYVTKLQKHSKKLLLSKIALQECKYRFLRFLLVCKLCFIGRIGNWAFYKQSPEEITRAFEYAYYKQKIREIEEDLSRNADKLKKLQKQDILKKLTSISKTLLFSYLKNNYQKPPSFDEKQIYSKPQEFCKNYPIIFSTTHSIRRCFDFREFLLDYIIVDESSQVDLVTGSLALLCAKNIVVVGDSKQLPNVITSQDCDKIKAIEKNYTLPQNFHYLSHSFLSSIIASFTNLPKTLLKEHYRCHPKIINFCNKRFYGNELVILSDEREDEPALEVIYTERGNHARGMHNQREADVVCNEVLPKLKYPPNDIGIIAPYREQVACINECIKKYASLEIQVDTVHSYQGREKEVIILTTTANENNPFIDDPKLLNVAITRAKKRFILITSKTFTQTQSNVSDFVRYITYHKGEIKTSNIKSIFDLLYKANAKAREDYLKGRKRISAFDSENLVYIVIQRVLENHYKGMLDIVSYVPLANLITPHHTDEEERRFIQHGSHFDFVIYHIMDKSLVLAIEVDGYAFHTQEKQKRRDGLKNKICQQYHIPLLRLNTTESQEEERIKKALENVLNFKTQDNLKLY